MSLFIKDFSGTQYPRKGTAYQESDYKIYNNQYATSSYQNEHDMNPALIVRPRGDDDIKKAVKWAVANKVSVAVKSGGHQYSGASSTSGNNIQIDLSNTYKDLSLEAREGNSNPLVLAGVSNRLADFLAYLSAHGLFIPTGQCAYVGVGGHVQTGGYGQLGRAFGLIGDHIKMIRMVCHDGEIREFGPGPGQEPEIFNAILGGSPGNFGIVTHYLIQVYRDQDYQVAPQGGFKQGGPHAIKAVWVYSKKILTALLTEVAKMAKDQDFPRGFDLCVSILGAGNPLEAMFEKLQNNAMWRTVEKLIEGYLKDPDFFENLAGPPAVVILYAQWCPTSPSDKYDKKVDDWFNSFRKFQDTVLPGIPLVYGNLQFEELNSTEYPMSKMANAWIMPREREFPLPYVKRTYATSSTTLLDDNWIATVVDRIDRICNRKYSDISNHQKPDLTDEENALYKNCKISAQIQPFGGKNGKFASNANNGTSYSWRDSTVLQTLDCFHMPTPEAKALAVKWQTENDQIMNGPKSSFSKVDKRVLWGSWGDWDMKKTWQYYYETREKYERIGRLRARADPAGTFTPNPFAVERIIVPN